VGANGGIIRIFPSGAQGSCTFLNLRYHISMTHSPFLPQRFIDYVPMTIEHELNQMFVNNLQDLLFSSITQEAETPGRLEELVQESSSLAKRRTRLATRRADLLKIKQKINTFWSLTRTQTRNHSQEPGSTWRTPNRSSSVSADGGDFQSIVSSTRS
jgi:hypothetical protein